MEGISARIHPANSQGDRANEGRRSAGRHSTNSLEERVIISCVTLVASIVITSAIISVSRSGGVKVCLAPEG